MSESTQSRKLYSPMVVIPWEEAQIDIDGKKLQINNNSDMVGYIPVYDSLDKLRELHGAFAPYNTWDAK